MFQNSVVGLRAWIERVRTELATFVPCVDVQSAEAALQKHDELRTEMQSKRDEFAYVNELGTRLLLKSPGLADVKVRIFDVVFGVVTYKARLSLVVTFRTL